MPSPQLQQLITQYQQAAEAKHHLAALKERIAQTEAEVARLDAIVDKEFYDVLQMEKPSLEVFFRKVLQNYERQYDLEKQELLLAIMNYDDGKASLQQLREEADSLVALADREVDLQQRLEQLIKQRAEEIGGKYPGIRSELVRLELAANRLVQQKRVLSAAIIKGAQCKKSLQAIVQLLEQIRRQIVWGFVEGETRTARIGQDRSMDKARESSSKVRQMLQAFKDQVIAIYESRNLPVGHLRDKFDQLINVYHFRLMSDWVASTRLAGILNCLEGTLLEVTQMVDTLKMEQKKTEGELAAKERERDVLLLTVG